jgi:hypothetical protein
MNVNLNKTDNNDYVRGFKDGKKAGVAEWARKAEGLVTALEWIKTYGPCDDLAVKFIVKALAKYKEVGNER